MIASRLGMVLVLSAALTAVAVPAAAARVEIILDVSGSMRATLGSETKMEAAKKAIRSTVDGIQPGSVVGLRYYGHRVLQEKKAESCRDTELVIPFQAIDKPRFLAVLDRAVPRGQTPLTYSLEQAAQDFGSVSDEERVIILVSDGEETCGGDPEAAARRLMEQGFKVKVHTIGFDVDAAARAQLEAISHATGGEYRDARDASALADSLRALTTEALLIAKGSSAMGEAIRGGDSNDAAVRLQTGNLYHLDHHQRQNQYDYFYVEAKAGQKIIATVETGEKGVSIEGDTFNENTNPYAGIEVQDGQRKKVGGDIVHGALNDKAGVQFALGSGQGGRFYVLIGNPYAAQHKDCRFRVELQNLFDAGSDRDAGSRDGEAIEVKPGSYKGYLYGNDSVDSYRFKVTAGATYEVKVRPAAEKRLELAVADSDGAIVKQAEAPNAGAAVRLEGLQFPTGGEAVLKVKDHHIFATPQIESEYALDLAGQGGGILPSGAGGGTDWRGLFDRAMSLAIWSGIPLLVGGLAGMVAGYIMGRRRRR